MSKSLGDTERFQLNQAIERRGGIRFNYAPLKDLPARKVTWIPFYENPMITESRRANYAQTKIYLRNEPVRLYTGSEARKFKVDIHYSLIHMAAMLSTYDMSDLFSVGDDNYKDIAAINDYLTSTAFSDTHSDFAGEDDGALIKDAFERSHSVEGPWGPNRWFRPSQTTAPPPAAERRENAVQTTNNTTMTGNSNTGYAITHTSETQSRTVETRRSPTAPTQPSEISVQSSPKSAYWNFALLWVMRTTPGWLNHHRVLQKVINNIRSSVIGTQQMPVKGPPIVELKWGTMYDFTPCIVTDYKLQPIENAGYDTKSLTAQRLKVSLTLEEMRNINGNLWGDPKIGGDLPGWDTIADLGNIDPTNPGLEGSRNFGLRDFLRPNNG